MITKNFKYNYIIIKHLFCLLLAVSFLFCITSKSMANDTNKVKSLSFSWNMPVGMASFQRSGYLWVVFDHRQIINTHELQNYADDMIEEIIQIPHSIATVLRIKPRIKLNTSARQEGLLWIIDLYTGEAPNFIKEFPIFTQQNTSDQSYLFIPTTKMGYIVSIIDPEVGDSISIAPVTDTGIGVKKEYNYPEFDMLSSAQGLAIVSKTPNVTLNRGNTGLTIRGRNRGLNISRNLDLIKRQENMAKDSTDTNSFDIDIDKHLLNLSFNDAENQLKLDIAKANADEKVFAQLNLAKYYATLGLGTNALSVISKIKKSKHKIINTERFNAIEGVANFLTKRYDEALDNFSFGTLPDINEAIFWRTLAMTNNSFSKENNIILLSYLSLIKDYPQILKDRIAIIGAKNSLFANDDISAQNFIDILKTSKDKYHNHSDLVRLLSAKKMAIQGFTTSAFTEYTRLGRSASIRYSSLARFEAARLGSKSSLMPVKKAISELEKLKFTWNEPEFKSALYKELAKLYIKDKNYHQALSTLNDAYLDDITKDKNEIESQMISLFEDIFIHNQADDIPSIKSLALFNDFEWLAKKSKKHNDIVQRFADRLVAVDLLPRADILLTNLLNNKKVTLVEKSSIGTRLAVVKLFSGKANDAITILDETEIYGIPTTLQNHRRIIRAKALEKQGHIEEALDLLTNDNSKNAILLKSEFYWNANRWGEAADTIKLLVKKPAKNKPLSDEQIVYILDWATALKRSGKETVLVRVKNKFAKYFINTKYYSAFSVLTDTLEKDKIDFAAINKTINDIKAFSNFTKIYNNALISEGFKEAVEKPIQN